MRRLRLALGLCAVTGVFVGCGSSRATPSEHSLAGLQAAARAVIGGIERGDPNTCAMIVPAQRAECPTIVARAHYLLAATKQRLPNVDALIAHAHIVISGNRATFTNAQGKREEAIYTGRWLFHLTGGSPTGESASEPQAAQGSGAPAAESRAEPTPQGESNVDNSVKIQVRALQVSLETFATDHNASYVGATIQGLELIEPTLANHELATPAVEAAGEKEYVVSSTGTSSGDVFKIERTANGEILRQCHPAGQQGCPASGVW